MSAWDDEMADALRLWRYLATEAQEAFRNVAQRQDEEGRYALAQTLSVVLVGVDNNRAEAAEMATVEPSPLAADEKRKIHRFFNDERARILREMRVPFRKPASWKKEDDEAEEQARAREVRLRRGFGGNEEER